MSEVARILEQLTELINDIVPEDKRRVKSRKDKTKADNLNPFVSDFDITLEEDHEECAGALELSDPKVQLIKR